MAGNSEQLEILLTEYEQLKEETRGALDLYDKVYSIILVVVAAFAGLLQATNITETEVFYAFVPAVILGILGVVWYGHQVSLARLSSRLEVIEFQLSQIAGRQGFCDWQSNWQRKGRGRWQKLLAIIAMLPSGVLYCIGARKGSVWISREFSGHVSEGVIFAAYVALLAAFAFYHHFAYMPQLTKQLKAAVEAQKKEIRDASVSDNRDSKA